MQPCGVCGGTAVDAAGYCSRCRSYRGQPAPQPPPEAYDVSAPAGGPSYPGNPYGGAGYGGAPYPAPSSGAPFASGAPYGPVSEGAPYGPVSAGPSQLAAPVGGYPPGYQPGYAPPPPPPARTRSSFVVPLIALSVVLVIVVAGIVAVVLIRSGEKKPTTQGNAALVDQCVVGTWKVTSHSEDIALDNGKVRFIGNGATVTYNKDGTGVTDYGKGTDYKADMNGLPVTLVVTGKVTYDFRTDNGTVSFSNVHADGTLTVNTTGLTTSAPLTGDDSPAKYTCAGDKLTQTTNLANIEMARQ